MLTINIEGIFPKDCLFFEHDIAITESEHYFFGVFKKLWLESGGSINGTFKAKNLAKSDEPIARSISEPLIIVLTEMLKESNNLIARNVFLSLPIDSKRKNYRKARRKVSQSMSNNAISWKRVNTIENGSGLSRQMRLKPSQISSVLIDMYEDPILGPEYFASLAVGGRDGTLRRRFQEDNYSGHVRGKTGSINGVYCLSSYVIGGDGELYTFVFFANNIKRPTSFVRNLQDSMISQLIDLPTE